jgi:hypothetical protein
MRRASGSLLKSWSASGFWARHRFGIDVYIRISGNLDGQELGVARQEAAGRSVASLRGWNSSTAGTPTRRVRVASMIVRARSGRPKQRDTCRKVKNADGVLKSD